MIDHANELRRHARKIPHPQGETPGVMLRAADEIECLRAKIEAIEQQEPVAWRTFDGEGVYDFRSYEGNENYKLGWDARNPNHAGWVEPLYALPGAKGEEE